MPTTRLLNFLDTTHPTLFNDRTRAFLESQFEVTHFDRADWSPQTIQKYFCEVQPQVILTGWGCQQLQLTDALISSVPSLQIWAHVGSSLKAIFDAPNTIERLRVLNTAPVIGRYVAESTVGHLIYGLRCFRLLNGMLQEGNHWGHLDKTPECEKSLYHATVGLVGLGKVGREVVRLLQPFGAKLLVHDPYLAPEMAREMGLQNVSLKVLLEESDAISLHAAATEETHHLIDAKSLQLMRTGSGIINTARGALIDTAALAQEIAAGRLWCAIDTYEEERKRPITEDPLVALAHLPHCFVTPHVAGIVPSARAFMVEELLQEAQKVLLHGGASPLTASRDAFYMG